MAGREVELCFPEALRLLMGGDGQLTPTRSEPIAAEVRPGQDSRSSVSVPVTTPATDLANRIGELKSRTNVIQHVFETRFLPSIPPNGFCRETLNCPTTPWQDGVTPPPPP